MSTITIISKTTAAPTMRIKHIPCRISDTLTAREQALVWMARQETAQAIHDLLEAESREACHSAHEWSERAKANPESKFHDDVARERREYFLGTNHCVVTLRNWCKDNDMEV